MNPTAGPRRIVAVAGNIGAGKSSLVEWICAHFDIEPFFEPNDENPFLSDFYGDMPRWAFHSQAFFLIRRFGLHKVMQTREKDVVQDRTIYEDAEVFATHLFRQGHMATREWNMYQELYAALREELRPPDLLIYLRCPVKVLRQRIRKRGRQFEQQVSSTYLRALDTLYEEWVARYDRSPVIVLNTGELDYVENLFDHHALRQTIAATLSENPSEIAARRGPVGMSGERS